MTANYNYLSLMEHAEVLALMGERLQASIDNTEMSPKAKARLEELEAICNEN